MRRRRISNAAFLWRGWLEGLDMFAGAVRLEGGDPIPMRRPPGRERLAECVALSERFQRHGGDGLVGGDVGSRQRGAGARPCGVRGLSIHAARSGWASQRGASPLQLACFYSFYLFSRVFILVVISLVRSFHSISLFSEDKTKFINTKQTPSL